MALSLALPYWRVELTSSNHLESLHLAAYVGHFEGAPESFVGREQLELSQQVAAGTGLALLALAAIFVRHRWAALLGLPAIGFPLVMMADLAGWLPAALCTLGEMGCRGDPAPLWGRLEVAGQVLVTRPGCGLALCAIAALTVAAGLGVAIGAGRRSSI